MSTFALRMMTWLTANWVEVVGASLALAYLILEVKQNWVMWIIGVVSSLFYVYIFFGAKLYAEMGMNVYYVLMSFYGLYAWKIAKPKENESPKGFRHITWRQTLWLSIVTLLIISGLVFVLRSYTDSEVPIPDALIAGMSIVATWMVAKKIVECWYLWIFVNFFAIGLYAYQALYPTAILYVFYGILSIVGLLEWNKSLKVKPFDRK